MIKRDIVAASQREFDLVVVGGGIYGVSLLQEAARRGLSACLCEAGDFGGGTSWNSLRIVHGGLRYLQTADLRRFFQSVAARRRVAQQFPTLVRPLQCLMPLYRQGMKRASIMRMALLMNDVLSARRNVGLAESVRLPGGRVIDAAATQREFPQVRTAGLEGAACWSDYFMISSERILIELLHDACRHGAMALNYARAIDVVSESGVARGVRVRDELTGADLTIGGRAVVNCAGPWLRDLARSGGADAGQLFRPSLAFNLLLDVDLPTGHALAVAAPQPEAPMLFLMPQPGALLAGTMHLPRPAETTEAVPTESEIAGFLGLLNGAIPGLGVGLGNVRRVFGGLLPAAAIGSNEIAKREVVHNHGTAGGLQNFYTVSGVKFTTANDVAAQVIAMTGAMAASPDPEQLQVGNATPLLTDATRIADHEPAVLASVLQRVIEEESVQCLDDLVMRRSSWATTLPELDGLKARIGALCNLPTQPTMVASPGGQAA